MSTRLVRCVHCGCDKRKHRLVNFADGPLVGSAMLICPRSVYQDKPVKRKVVKP